METDSLWDINSKATLWTKLSRRFVVSIGTVSYFSLLLGTAPLYPFGELPLPIVWGLAGLSLAPPSMYEFVTQGEPIRYFVSLSLFFSLSQLWILVSVSQDRGKSGCSGFLQMTAWSCSSCYGVLRLTLVPFFFGSVPSPVTATPGPCTSFLGIRASVLFVSVTKESSRVCPHRGDATDTVFHDPC